MLTIRSNKIMIILFAKSVVLTTMAVNSTHIHKLTDAPYLRISYILQ